MSVASAAPPQRGTPSSSLPSLAEPFEPTKGDKKNKMLGLFGIGKKKTTEDPANKAIPKSNPTSTAATSSSKLSKDARSTAASPLRTDRSLPAMPASPSRGLSSSPRLLSSPNGSQIFERDVTEGSAHIPNSPAIPSHIKTEDYVPSVLDASSEAITDNHLTPDTVEIITHASHQPASVNVTGHPDHLSNNGSSWQDDLAASLSAADFRPVASGGGDLLAESTGGSNYGSLDSADVRRLSFISFADVVQAEHHAGMGTGAGSRESIHLAGLTSLASMGAGNIMLDHRSPSPIRSPVSSTTGDPTPSLPNSKPVSEKGVETSPSRKPIGSPSVHPMSPIPAIGIPGEVNVETMAQALKRTESGDLGGVKSHPTSPIDVPSR